MSRIKSKNTAPEIKTKSFLRSMGITYKTHVNNLPGKPDIVLSRNKTAIFVHGCFWHRHRNCKYSYTPKSRINFWNSKFKQNISRFIEVKKQLAGLKWNVIVVWECQANSIKKMEKVMRKLSNNRQKDISRVLRNKNRLRRDHLKAVKLHPRRKSI